MKTARSTLVRRLGPPGLCKSFPVETERHALAYVFEGSGSFRSASQAFGVLTEKEIDGSQVLIRERTGNRSLVLFDSGDEVTVQVGEEGIRFLLVSEKPLGTRRLVPTDRDEHAAELQQAARELRDGAFIKSG